jgi:hypothetical protein
MVGLLVVLSVSIGTLAAVLSGEAAESVGFVLFDTAQTFIAAVAARLLATRLGWGRAHSR